MTRYRRRTVSHVARRCLAACLLPGACATSPIALAHPAAIDWDRSTLTYVGPGGYARIARLDSKQLLLSLEHAGKSFVRHSLDEGRTWGEPILAADFAHGAAANPELLVLRDRTIWLLYNERPRAGSGKPFTIRLTVSRDGGKTWTARTEPLYVAGTRAEEGCWEPSAIEMPDGEIRVFFANEAPYPDSNEQEITMLGTRDRGETFSPPTGFAFRAGARDGMPVPARLADGSVVVAIEDSGLTPDGQMKPVLVHLARDHETQTLPVHPGSAARWPAIERDWPGGLYAGAPYLVAMPDGTTVLSVQSIEFSKEQQMVVYLGNPGARGFANPTRPFPVDPGHSARWNSLFAKAQGIVTAASGTTIGGKSGIWTIDGTIRSATPETNAPGR